MDMVLEMETYVIEALIDTVNTYALVVVVHLDIQTSVEIHVRVLERQRSRDLMSIRLTIVVTDSSSDMPDNLPIYLKRGSWCRA